MQMKQYKIKDCYGFLSLLIIGVIASAIALILLPKHQLHISITAHHSPAADVFFRAYTHLGEAWVWAFALIFLFIRFKDAILIIASQLTAGLFAQIIKHIYNAPRPKVYFAQLFPEITLHQVPDVQLHSWHSFPSGHTTTAFALFMALTCIVAARYKPLQVLFFFMALLVAYSRIYLSQHFLIDVCAGAIIGASAAILWAHYLNKSTAPALQSSLLKIKSKKNT